MTTAFFVLSTITASTMNDDIEDMLFGLGASHGDFEICGSDVFEAEILDYMDDDDETNLWDVEDYPLLTPDWTDCSAEPLPTGAQHEADSSRDVARSARDR